MFKLISMYHLNCKLLVLVASLIAYDYCSECTLTQFLASFINLGNVFLNNPGIEKLHLLHHILSSLLIELLLINTIWELKLRHLMRYQT